MFTKKNLTDPRVREWILEFQDCQRELDFERGRKLFCESMFGFGTICPAYDSLDEYHDNQWQYCWNRTRDITYDLSSFKVLVDESLNNFVLCGQFVSDGFTLSGEKYFRHARCTIVLVEDSSGFNGLKAVHCHFSKSPDPDIF